MAERQLHDPRESLKPLVDAGADGAERTVTSILGASGSLLTVAHALIAAA